MFVCAHIPYFLIKVRGDSRLLHSIVCMMGTYSNNAYISAGESCPLLDMTLVELP